MTEILFPDKLSLSILRNIAQQDEKFDVTTAYQNLRRLGIGLDHPWAVSAATRNDEWCSQNTKQLNTLVRAQSNVISHNCFLNHLMNDDQ
ncbi:hypothetical protein RRG08_050994 [Elysia crispata]|uniref:Uncharacterized protein n=1 Tax=Elysia crispata TaxID=231223 RepID=A0AAE0YWG4_9GAST|nr:hypothetical protein RRG08_050994 [Elysia crispata]